MILGVLSTITTAISSFFTGLGLGIVEVFDTMPYQPSTDEAARLERVTREALIDDPHSLSLRQRAVDFARRAFRHRDWLGDHFDSDWGALRPA